MSKVPWLVKDGKAVLGTVHTPDIDLALSAARNRWPKAARWLTVTNYKQPGHTEEFRPDLCPTCGHKLGGMTVLSVAELLLSEPARFGVLSVGIP